MASLLLSPHLRRMLLAHNSGLPGWLPLFNESSPERALEAALTCPFAYPPTTRVVYSDIGLIILGEALRRLEGISRYFACSF
jgi:CubicO group peptidase (beta-lactamase class C family)